MLKKLSSPEDWTPTSESANNDELESDFDVYDADPGAAATDPVIALALGWYQASKEFNDRRRRIERLSRRLPDWVFDWQGIFLGSDGVNGVTHARCATTLHRYFDRLAQEAHDLEEWDRVEKRRRAAVAELRLWLAAVEGAYRAAGLPVERDTEPDFRAPIVRRIEAFEQAIEHTPALSVAGLVAKWRHTADYLRFREKANPGPESQQTLSHVHRMVTGMFEDLDRLGLDTMPS